MREMRNGEQAGLLPATVSPRCRPRTNRRPWLSSDPAISGDYPCRTAKPVTASNGVRVPQVVLRFRHTFAWYGGAKPNEIERYDHLMGGWPVSRARGYAPAHKIQ